MIQTSLAKRIATTAAAGMMFCSLGATVGSAAEIKVLSSVALTSALNQIAPSFEQVTGNKLNIGYSLIADIKKRMLDGETADVIILSRPVMDELGTQEKFTSGSITNIAGTPVALAIRAGTLKPDISTVDTLKSTLLAAKSIAYADPAKGGAAGVYFAHVVDRLGIADQLKSKTILVPGAQAPELVAKGEAEIGVAQTSEIVPVAGAEVLGPLPGEFASTTVFAAGIGATTKSPEVAKSLIQFLAGPVARPVLSAKGFQPS
jgi:molybdate transport system substrate-binding protein